jgi:D-aminoacyl-tRNA deacylase
VASTIDPASVNIKMGILEKSEWEEIDTFSDNPVNQLRKSKDIILITINDRKINHENLDDEVKEKLDLEFDHVIFISRHTSKTGNPTLTVHPIGNYGPAEFGGKLKTLVEASPVLMTQLLRNLKKNAKLANLYHKVCFEVTHHGPYLKTPTLFVEVGSNEDEWKKTEPARIVAKSVIELLESYLNNELFIEKIPVIIGLGGGHYAPRFTDVALAKKVAFGHMIPMYHIKAGNIDKEMIEIALRKSPESKGVYIHKKSMKKSQVTEYKNWFKSRDIKVFSSKELEDL